MFEDHQRDDDHAHNGGSIGNPKRRNDRDDINFTIRMVLEEDSVNKIRLDPFTDPFLAFGEFQVRNIRSDTCYYLSRLFIFIITYFYQFILRSILVTTKNRNKNNQKR